MPCGSSADVHDLCCHFLCAQKRSSLHCPDSPTYNSPTLPTVLANFCGCLHRARKLGLVLTPGFPRKPSLAPLPLLSTVCSVQCAARSRPSIGCSTYICTCLKGSDREKEREIRGTSQTVEIEGPYYFDTSGELRGGGTPRVSFNS